MQVQFFWEFYVYATVELYKRFHVLEKKRRSSIELSNNICERRCEMKANEPMSEWSERASGYFTDLLPSERSDFVGKSGIYYIINILVLNMVTECCPTKSVKASKNGFWRWHVLDISRPHVTVGKQTLILVSVYQSRVHNNEGKTRGTFFNLVWRWSPLGCRDITSLWFRLRWNSCVCSDICSSTEIG